MTSAKAGFEREPARLLLGGRRVGVAAAVEREHVLGAELPEEERDRLRTLARTDATSTTVTMPMTIPSTARIERSGCAATESWVRRDRLDREVAPAPRGVRLSAGGARLTPPSPPR